MKKYPVLIWSIALVLILSVIGFTTYRRYYYQPKGALRLRPGATMQKQFDEALAQFYQRTTVDAYIQVGHKSDAWNGDAMRLLDGYAHGCAGVSDAPTPQAQSALARSILQKGCNDPLIRYVYAGALCDQQKKAAAISHLRRATEDFAKSGYPKVHGMMAPLLLADCLTALAPERSEEIGKMHELSEQWAAAAMHDGCFLSNETRIVLLLITRNAYLYTHLESLLSMMAASPGDDPYVLKYLQGINDLALALALRNNNTPEDRRLSQEKLKTAYQSLHAAWKQHPEYPEAPTQIMTIARIDAKVGGSPREWFGRAIAAQCDYQEAYTGMISSLLPCYGGSYEKMYAFGKECLNTGRYDTIIPSMFHTVLCQISADAKGAQDVWHQPETPAYLETMFKGYEASADPNDQPYYKSLHAAVAWYYHRYEEAMHLLDELGDRVDPKAFTTIFNTDFAQARDEIYRKAAPCGPLIAQAEKLYQTKGAAAGRAEYQRILGRGGWSPYLTELLHARIAVLSIEEQFKKDGWVDLFPHPGLSGWKPVCGRWLPDKDGTLTGIPDDHGLLLLCKMRFPARLELRGEVELPANGTSAAGLVLGGRDAAINGNKLVGNSLAFLIENPSGTAIFRHSTQPKQVFPVKLTMKTRNMLRIVCWNGKVTAYLNGKPVNGTSPTDPQFASPLIVGLSAESTAPGMPMKFRRLQIRRLTEEPADVTSPPSPSAGQGGKR